MQLSVEFLNIKVRSINRSIKRINNFNKFNYLKCFFFFINILLLTVLIKNFKKRNLNKNLIINCYFRVKVGKLLNPPKDRNASIFEKEKKGLLKYLSKCTKRKLEKVESIFLNVTARFGNQLIILNKVIFFCEILKCKRIILNKEIYWFIKKKNN